MVRTFFHPLIVMSVLAIAVYTVAVVWLLWAVHVWHQGFVKDTILWFCFSGVVMVANFVTSKDNENIFKAVAKDNIKAVLLVEFVVNAFNFSLTGELLFVPFMTFVVLLNAVSSLRDEHKPVATLTGWVLAIIGFTLLYLSVADAIAHYQEFGNFDTLRSIVLPPLLSLLFAPFLFVFVLLTTYEQVFMRLRLGASKPRSLLWYARRRILWHFGCNLSKLKSFLSANALHLMQLQDRADVDQLLSSSQPNTAS
ncbi:MAG: hypothetical protein WAO83_12145 [Fuerstiella sp.]